MLKKKQKHNLPGGDRVLLYVK